MTVSPTRRNAITRESFLRSMTPEQCVQILNTRVSHSSENPGKADSLSPSNAPADSPIGYSQAHRIKVLESMRNLFDPKNTTPLFLPVSLVIKILNDQNDRLKLYEEERIFRQVILGSQETTFDSELKEHKNLVTRILRNKKNRREFYEEERIFRHAIRKWEKTISESKLAQYSRINTGNLQPRPPQQQRIPSRDFQQQQLFREITSSHHDTKVQEKIEFCTIFYLFGLRKEQITKEKHDNPI